MESFLADSLIYLKIAVTVILTFGLAVFVHEFGHMFFALIRGVGVESFAIGMGPKICDWKWGGIEFSLRWLPIGGFVKLQGMIAEDPAENPAPDPNAPHEDHQSPAAGLATAGDLQVDTGKETEGKTLAETSYDDMLALSNKGLLTKLMVFGGGVFMNYITAIIAMVFLGMMDKKVEVTKYVLEDAVGLAKEYGLQAGDRIVAVNGTPLEYDYDYGKLVIEQHGETLKAEAGEIPAQVLTVERAGQQIAVNVPALPVEKFLQFRNDQILARPAIVGELVMTYPAEKAGLLKGDRITAVNDVPIYSWEQLIRQVEPQPERELKIAVDRAGTPMEFKLITVQSIENPGNGQIGISAGGADATIVEQGEPFVTALVNAPGETWFRMKYLVKAQVEFFRKATMKQIAQNVGGPVSIGRLTARFANMGLAESVSWFITLNLLLMVFNLLPLPVLDGGFIVLSFIEAIIRRPVPAKVLAPIYTTFTILFIGLMLTITFWDVKRWLF